MPSLRDFAKAHYGHGTETLCAQGQYSGDAVTQLCSDAGTDAGVTTVDAGTGGTGSIRGGSGCGCTSVDSAGIIALALLMLFQRRSARVES